MIVFQSLFFVLEFNGIIEHYQLLAAELYFAAREVLKNFLLFIDLIQLIALKDFYQFSLPMFCNKKFMLEVFQHQLYIVMVQVNLKGEAF